MVLNGDTPTAGSKSRHVSLLASLLPCQKKKINKTLAVRSRKLCCRAIWPDPHLFPEKKNVQENKREKIKHRRWSLVGDRLALIHSIA
jgi:hypothetical protein